MNEQPTDGTTIPHAPQPSEENALLFGRFGMRAGYGVLLFVVVVVLLGAIGGFLALGASGQMAQAMAARAKSPGGGLAGHIQLTATYVTVQNGVEFFGLLGFCWLMSRAERRRLGQYGLGASRVRDVVPGAAWGIVSMSVLVWFLKMRGLIVFDGRNLYGGAVVGYGLFWLAAFVMVALCEEYLFRGYMLYTITRGLWGLGEKLAPSRPQAAAFWMASFVMSATFAAMHMANPGENAFGLFEVFFIGMAFCYSIWRTGSLWWGLGYHALWDFMQSFTFGVADSGSVSVGRLFLTHPHGARLLSGGADGPEGSVYSLVAAVLTFAVVRVTTRPGAYPSPEQLLTTPLGGPPESTVTIPYNQLNA